MTLHHFISPISGKIRLDPNYIPIGDANGNSYASPVLIDLRQDVIDLRRSVGTLELAGRLLNHHLWIGDENAKPIPTRQIGIINLPDLVEATFPNPLGGVTGDLRIPNPTFDYTSAFDWVMSGPFLPQIFATSYNLEGDPIGTNVSSSLAMVQVRAAQIMKRFDHANFIVGSNTVEFLWENPKMALIPESIKTLYNLGTTYTFTQAQSLGSLETGLLKNTVADNHGTLSQALSGEDYVNTFDLPVGNLVVMDPLYPIPGHKLIAPITFASRKNQENEFGESTAGTIDVLTGPAAKLNRLAIQHLTPDAMVKVGSDGELIDAEPDTDYTTPSVIATVIDTIETLQAAYDTFVTETTTKDAAQDASITEIETKNIAQDASITSAETAIGTLEGELATATATFEAEIAALAGVETLSILVYLLSLVGITAGGKAYGDYIRGQTLNVKNTWKAADLNDEGHNAVGDFEFRYPTGYSTDDRGFSTLWFDSNNRSDTHPSEAGLRLFSWDSGGDHAGNDNPLAPLHMGIFGYQNKYNILLPNPTARYKGFIFSSDFNHGDSDDDDYRFPNKFGLYDVTRTISTLTASESEKYGWDSKNTIFEYDYDTFAFHTKMAVQRKATFDEADFSGDVSMLSHGALTLPTGTTAQRPGTPLPGMIRLNTSPH